MIAGLAASAIAASPAGWWVDDAVPADAIAVRSVYVPPAAGAPPIVEGTVEADFAMGDLRFGASLPALWTGTAGWTDAGLGLLGLTAGVTLGPSSRPTAVGVRLRGPAGPARWGVSSWGSHAAATVPALGASWVVASTSRPDAPRTWTVELGVSRSPYLWGGAMAVTGGAGLVQVVPIVGPLSWAVEAEVLRDPTPVSTRTWLRVDGGAPARVVCDVGVQVPGRWPVEAHPIVQVRGYVGRR